MSQVKQRSKFRGYENFDDEPNRKEVARINCTCEGIRCTCFDKLLEQLGIFLVEEQRYIDPVYVEIKKDETTGEEIEVLHKITVKMGDVE